MATYDGAELLCTQAGGRLCTDEEFARLRHVELGCFFGARGHDTWTEGSAEDKVGPLYPRCCADFASVPMPARDFLRRIPARANLALLAVTLRQRMHAIRHWNISTAQGRLRCLAGGLPCCLH